MLKHEEKMTQLCKNVFHFRQSKQHESNTEALFSCNEPTPLQHNAAVQIVYYLRQLLISLAAKDILERAVESSGSSSVPSSAGSEAGRGKIRYIGGWCIATLTHREKEYVLKNLYASGSQQKVRLAQRVITHLEKLEATEWELEQHSSEPASLQEISRKQNIRRSLTNIADEVYTFFITLDSKIRQLESFQSAQVYGEDMYKHIRESLQSDSIICKKWVDLFDLEEMENEGPLTKLFDDVV
jgi:hypothetical protein